MSSPLPDSARRPSFYLLVIVLIALLAGMPGFRAQAQEKPVILRNFLEKHVHLTQDELAALDRGKVVTKTLPTQDKREIAVFGIVFVHVSAEKYARKFEDIENFKKSKMVLQIHKFQTPPQLSDLASLQLPKVDLDSLRDCRVGHCGVKLPADMIARFHAEINWRAPGSKEKATALYRQALFGYVQAYVEGGNAALGEYNDKKHPVRLADEFAGLLRYSPYLNEYAPEFHSFLENYPKEKLEDTKEFLYWSMETFGLKPTISVTHVTIYRQEGAKGETIFIATKQIAASHYFDASLGLTVLVEAEDARGKPGVYVVYVNRSRADALKGRFGGMRRGVVEGKTLNAMKKNLAELRDRLEAEPSDLANVQHQE